MTLDSLERRVDDSGTAHSTAISQEPKLVLVKPFQHKADYNPSLPAAKKFGEMRYTEKGLQLLYERLQRANIPLLPGTQVVSLTELGTYNESRYPYGILIQNVREELTKPLLDNGHVDEYIRMIGQMHAYGIILSSIELEKAKREERNLATEIFACYKEKVVFDDWTKLSLVDDLCFASVGATEEQRETSKINGFISGLIADFDKHGFGGVLQPSLGWDEGRRRAAIYLEAFKAAADTVLYQQYADYLPKTIFASFWRNSVTSLK